MLEHPVNLAYNRLIGHEQAASYGQSAGRLIPPQRLSLRGVGSSEPKRIPTMYLVDDIV